MLDGKQLRALFQQFNQQFFGSKLPACSIRVVPRMTSLGEAGRWNRAQRRIEIQNGLPDEDTISTLLHEMSEGAFDGLRWR